MGKIIDETEYFEMLRETVKANRKRSFKDDLVEQILEKKPDLDRETIESVLDAI